VAQTGSTGGTGGKGSSVRRKRWHRRLGRYQTEHVAQATQWHKKLDALDVHPQVVGHLLAEQLHTGAYLDVGVPMSNVLTGRLEQEKFT